MEFYSARNIKKLPEIKEQPKVKSRVFGIKRDKFDFVVQLLLDNTFTHPIANTIYLIFILLSLIISIHSGSSTEFIFAIGIVSIVKLRLITAYLNLYDAYNNNSAPFLHTIDSEGVHTVIKANYKRYIRLSTTRWEDVRHISVTKYFMSIQVAHSKRKETPIELSYIWSDDIEAVRDLALYYWKRALANKDGVRCYSYEYEEVDEVMEFVTEQLGEFDTLRRQILPDIKLGIAIIPPTKDRDYYTLCTIGGGGYHMNVPEELHKEYGIVEYAEYVMILPSWWKMDNESLEDEKWY